MNTSLKKADRLAHARRIFESASVTGWSLAPEGLELGQGSQNSVCKVIADNGVQGVFRCLPPKPSATEVKRFERELQALSLLDHPNVMKPLVTGSQPLHWYISRLGKDFSSYWKEVRQNLCIPEIELVAQQAFCQIATGLEACHSKSIVHRDIKPTNIIVQVTSDDFKLQIIDFGAIWVEDEEPLTEVNEIVANKAFSHDFQRFRSTEAPPWFDVFSAVQVFQWMLSEREPKHYWQRPIHWKYVQYPAESSQPVIDSLRAMGAITSLDSTCPPDGAALLRLIQMLFPEAKSNQTLGTALSTNQIEIGIASGHSKKLLREATDIEAIEASLPLAKRVLQEVVAALTSIILDNRVTLSERPGIEEVVDSRFEANCVKRLITFSCRSRESTGHFSVSLSVHAFVPSRWPRGGKPSSLLNTNAFVFTVERSGPTSGTTPFPYVELKFAIEPDSCITRRSDDWTERLETVSATTIRTTVIDLLSDQAAWRTLSSL